VRRLWILGLDLGIIGVWSVGGGGSLIGGEGAD